MSEPAVIIMSANGRGPVGPAIIYPGDTPADRYDWLMARMSSADRRHMELARQSRRAWLRVNNPDVLRAA